MDLTAPDYPSWQQLRLAQRMEQAGHVSGLRNHLITIVVYDGGTPDAEPELDATLGSLLQQNYRNIEVLVVGTPVGNVNQPEAFISCRGLFFEPELSHLGILRDSASDQLWRGSHVMFARAGTTFDSDAFSLLNASLNAAPGMDGPDLVLCDYDIATSAHEFTQPTFTPGWDPDFIQSQDYIRTAFLASRRLILNHRTEASACGSLHDWLCVVARAEARLATGHVTETLAHLPHSAPPTAAPSPAKYAFPSQVPDLAVVIPTRNGAGLLAKCLGFLDFDNRFRTELVIVDNASDDPEVLPIYAQLRERHGAKIVQMDHRFNFARMINMGVEASRAPTILLLNNDVQITMPGLLEEILSHALRPEIGVVGTKLLYGDGKVQHAGMLLREGQSGVETLTALHVMRGASRGDSGYLNALSSVRNYQAVTGALMASRREVFLSVGGFDEVHLPVEYNDVDYCLRAREAGYRVVCLPFDGIFHFESSTRGVETSPEVALMRRQATAVMAGRWREQFRHDPYDNRWVELGDVAQEKFPWSAARRT